MIPEIPKGYRLVTEEEKASVAHLSSYLENYPRLLTDSLMWKEELGWKPGPWKWFWADVPYIIKDEK